MRSPDDNEDDVDTSPFEFDERTITPIEIPTPRIFPKPERKVSPPMEIAFEEKIASLSSRDLGYMIAAVNIQMRDHYCPNWSFEHWPCKAYSTVKGIPVGTFWPIAILPELDVKNAAGYHDFAAGLVYGRVRWTNFEQTALTASHEAIELRGDPFCNKWVDIGNGRKVAFEHCDPCEEDSYVITVKLFGESRKVKVSDFLLPSYFDPKGKRPFSYMDSIDHNVFDLGLSRNGGGYLIIKERNGTYTDYWGRRAFGMMRAKRPASFSKGLDLTSRFSRRLGLNDNAPTTADLRSGDSNQPNP